MEGEGDLQAAAALILSLRARGVRDLAVLRALEGVPRARFPPEAWASRASRDIALPLPCGQTLSAPSLVARMLEGLAVTPACRVLDVGTGSGYAAACLARLGREVLSVERFGTLARDARGRLAALGFAHVSVVWGDGLAVPADAGPFDRVLVHALLDDVPPGLADLVPAGGLLVSARRRGAGQALVRHERVGGGWAETVLGPSRLRPPMAGHARAL